MPASSPMIWIGAVAGLAILAIAAGVLAVAGPRATGAGPLLDIAVVAAPEREVAPGEILDVGQLTDGYVHTDARPQAAPEIIDAYLPEEDFRPEENFRGSLATPAGSPRMAGARPYASVASDDGAAMETASNATGPQKPLSFGFDAPRPDYAAEREARRARLDALDSRARQSGAATTGEAATAPDTFY